MSVGKTSSSHNRGRKQENH